MSCASHARAQGEEKLVQLRERLDHRIRRPGAGSVESFLRGIELVHDQQRLATLFLECHRGDRTTRTTFLIGPHEARVRCHFEVRAEERRSIGFELETVLAPDASIHLAGKQGHAHRLRHPPPPEQLGLGPRLEHDAGRAVEGSGDNQLTLGLPLHRRAVLHGRRLTLCSCVHQPLSFRVSSSTTVSSSSNRASQSWRYCSIHADASSSRRGPSMQVRTRPTFSVVTSPASSKTPTCFFMPVRVMWNSSARSVIEASARPSRSRTPRRVASESAPNEALSRPLIY